MATAIAMIKEEMGPHAIIMNTRKVKKADGAFGTATRSMVEVTAALDEEVVEDRQTRRSRATAVSRAQAKKSQASSTSATGRIPDADAIVSALEPIRDEISALKAMIGSAGFAGTEELKKATGLTDEIESIRSMMGFLLENSNFYRGIGLDPNYLVCYRRMLERGVDHEFALKLVREVKAGVPGGRELDLKSVVNLVIEKINKTLVVGDPIIPYSDGPKVAALIGPTGVGKTTTVAKIAARLTLEGKKVGLVTIDTYRIAAVEQLKVYAGILNVPLEVALTPEELVSAVAKFADKDVVLIDTAGRSQRDAKKLSELASFLGADQTIENYLVLSSSADPAAIDEAVRNFGCLEISGLIFTKLDETAKPGVVISQNFKTGIPVVYCTAGQRVPEDIEAASGPKLGAMLFKKSVDIHLHPAVASTGAYGEASPEGI